MNATEIAELNRREKERRDAACRAFWSDHPLNTTFRRSAGGTFTLRDFVAFVVAMPQDQFEACTGRRA